MTKKLTQWHNWKKVPPAHVQRVYSFLCPSFCLSVRAKRGIWSKRVFMRTNGNFSFSVCWRNDTIIHYFLLAKKVLDIFEKLLWLYGCRSIQCKKEVHSNRKFGSHCFWKIKKPNKNFLKLKCDWWNWYFDTTDGYMRFIPTDGQMTVPFFLGRNLIKEGTQQKT